ncbi:MAG: 1,2-phenylacetyl-CoA epoxidase subunit PaaD [Actinomycetota bacterium]
MVATRTLEDQIWESLRGVMDPEIPSCSVVDLGMVERVTAVNGTVEVYLLPTFVGCPAKDLIGEDVERALRTLAGEREIRVRFIYDPPWTTDRITDEGKRAMRSIGISPHWAAPGPTPIPLFREAGLPCPFCGSTETVQESAFGPTPCRSTHFCRACRNPFEGFKEKK